MQEHPKNSVQLVEPQHNSQVIIWSSSDSSEYENNYLLNRSYTKISNARVKKKRKREDNTISCKNISSGNIYMKECCKKSPVLDQKQLPDVGCTSPGFKSSKRYLSFMELNNKSQNTVCEEKQKSPVLLQKYISPKGNPKFTRKRVFKTLKNISKLDVTYGNLEQDDERSCKKSPVIDQKLCSSDGSTSPILKCKQFPSNKVSNNETIKQKSPILVPKYISPVTHYKHGESMSYKMDASSSRDICVSPDLFTQNSLNNQKVEIDNKENEEINNIVHDSQYKNNIDDSRSKGNKPSWINIDKTCIKDKMKKFISTFSSSSSEYIISECETPNSSCKSNTAMGNTLPELPRVEPPSKYVKSKKVNYEKGGLGFRLHGLLKKQNTISCLWSHERFLGIQPKQEEYRAFKIEQLDFKYGSYLLKLLNSSDGIFYLYLNNFYVKNNKLERDAVIKLFEPYNVICFDSYKLIINVCKYECTGK